MNDLDLKSIETALKTFAAKSLMEAAAGLLSGRSFVLPAAQDQISDQTDFELITWLVVR